MLKTALALFVLLLLSAGAARGQEPVAPSGLSGGEAVVRDFAGRMADGDFGGVLELFRFRLQAKHINHAAWLEAMMAVYPDGRLPVSRHSEYVPINAVFISESILAQ